jgi:hypothetical protein
MFVHRASQVVKAGALAVAIGDTVWVWLYAAKPILKAGAVKELLKLM